jgi:hypothetical protein
MTSKEGLMLWRVRLSEILPVSLVVLALATVAQARS